MAVIQQAPTILDAGMARPLIEEISTAISSPLSLQSEDMDYVQSTRNLSARDRVERINRQPSIGPLNSTRNAFPWRSDLATSALGNSEAHGNHSTFDRPYRGRSQSMMDATGPVPLSLVKPGPVWPAENQLKVAYTYGIRRPDGSYTRLIPADELENFGSARIPVQQGSEGMIVLPPLGQLHPELRMGPEEMVPHNVRDIEKRFHNINLADFSDCYHASAQSAKTSSLRRPEAG